MVRRDTSIQAQQSQNRRSYLPGAQGLAQTKRMGSRRTHTHGVANNSNRSVNTSATPALPVKGAELHGRVRGSKAKQTRRTPAQGIANDSRRSANTSDTVITPQDDWTKSKLPARSPKLRQEKPETWESSECIGRTHARAEHLSRLKNGYKSNG